MDRYKSLAVALESEVLSEMAGTFFGARKTLENMHEDFLLRVEELRAQADKVFVRVFFLRSLLLGPEGEAALCLAIGLPPQFADIQAQPGLPPWKPERIPFALFPSTRFAKLVLLAYAEMQHSCEVYMNGEYEDDPERKGRKRMTLHFKMVERLGKRLNERIEKLNADMPPSTVLQYARSISTAEAPGQGAITNALGAESLDKGLELLPLDLVGLKLWRAPDLPAAQDCEEKLRAFAAAYYDSHSENIRRVLAEL